MTVLEVLEQAKALSVEERKELAKLLIDSLEIAPSAGEIDDVPDKEPWGKRLIDVLQQTPMADWGDRNDC